MVRQLPSGGSGAEDERGRLMLQAQMQLSAAATAAADTASATAEAVEHALEVGELQMEVRETRAIDTLCP